MSAKYKLTKANDCLRLEIEGDASSSYEDYVEAVDGAKERLAAYEEELELQTFVNVKHESELEFFISQGFYVANTMIMMEKEVDEGEIKALREDNISVLNVDREGLSRYLKANKLGFDGIQDPEEQIRFQLSNPGGSIYILEHGGMIVSSVTVWDIDDETSATENIFTIPDFREQHCAWDLLTHVLNELKGAGKKKARLSVYGDDTPAHQMYLKMGYHIVDVNYELRY